MPSTATAGRTSFLPFCYNQAAARNAMNAGIPLFQAFSPIPVQRSTYCDCIKDGRKTAPCMGSGHILVYMFDVLEQIYTSVGYSEREAAKVILENNIYGLDIDDRAYQLAYFAVMMKARQYNRRILTSWIKAHVYSIQESNGITKNQLQEMGENLSPDEKAKALSQAEKLVELFHDAKEYGSILNIPEMDWDLLRRFATPKETIGQTSLNLHQEASKMIEIDLDDGVKHNYAIIQDVLAKIK